MADALEFDFTLDNDVLAAAYLSHGLTERDVHPDCPELAQAVHAAAVARDAALQLMADRAGLPVDEVLTAPSR